MQLKRLIFPIPMILLFLTRSGVDDKKLYELPHEVGSSGIVIEKQANYEGLFYENGGEEIAVNIAALVIRNESEKMLENVALTVQCDSESYLFCCTFLPPGEKVLIPEKQQKRWNNKRIENIYAEYDFIEDNRDLYIVTEYDKCELTVENRSGEDCDILEVCYKSYYPDDDLLLGGYTFKTSLYDLKAGESRQITAHHYAAGYSKVVFINRIGND